MKKPAKAKSPQEKPYDFERLLNKADPSLLAELPKDSRPRVKRAMSKVLLQVASGCFKFIVSGADSES